MTYLIQKNDCRLIDEADVDIYGKLPVAPLNTQKIELKIVWRNIIIFSILHISGIYGTYLFFAKIMWKTLFFGYFLGLFSSLGITAGAHRLWAHRSYKARLPLRVLLLFLNTLAGQDAVLVWVRDHRMHHIYSETDADPHNATRGFFFSHVGWLLVKKHPDIKAKGHTIDLSDLWADPLLRFQKKNYPLLMLLISIILPTCVPVLWGESLWNAFFTCAMLRYMLTLNGTWLVNSAAHMWGYKPYDKNISPVENEIVSFVAMGEGFHNYHHTFPWDYKTAELGNNYLNFTKLFIDVMAKIGWAYNLKTVSPELVERRMKRTGDVS